MLFTWDDEKEKINIKKHGINFSSAAAVFFDDDAIVETNYVDDYTGEERFDVIGLAAGHLMFVVYVERQHINEDSEDVIFRIISARKANKREEKRYAYGIK